MADTLLEQTRALHEDMERMERVIAKDLKRDFKAHKEKLLQSHRVKRRVDAIQEAARKLVKIYEDEDGSRKEEIAALSNKDNPFTAFYDRLREVRDYHKRFATSELTEMESDEAFLREEPALVFTGEEGLGRYLDLHSHYSHYLNAKFGNKELQYYEYVDGLRLHLLTVGRQHKLGAAYRRYVQALLDYLVSFYTRIQPLAQIAKQMSKVEDTAKAAFEAGSLAGWEDCGLAIITPQAAPTAAAGGMLALPAPELGPLDVRAYGSAEELEGAGADRLKEALAALGLKCGGTLKERAQRLWLTRDTPLHLMDKKLFAKGVAPPPPQPAEGNGAEGAVGFDASKRQQMALEVAVLEAQVSKMCELLAAVISDTKGRVEKRQAQTYEELLAEQEEAEQEAAPAGAGAAGEGGEGVGSDGEDEFVYNPLKLPLGWDGKPIPYWLYKLHGLNQEFDCEICGGFKYQGRRAYERHFKEWRHQNGMRALGIPNNKNFFEITRIADAQALWEDIQKKQKGGFKAETEEEYEDSSGNVYNKRTFLDLKRQGLL